MTEDIAGDLAKAEQHELLLQFRGFDDADAWELGTRMRARAFAAGLSLVIDIRRGDDCLFFTAMPGTSPANADWARRKRNLVNLVHMSSYRVGLRVAEGADLMGAMALDPRDHAPHGGCFPIHVIGTGVVGSVTVSGLPQRDDHKFAVDAIAEFLGVDLGEQGF